MSPFAAAANGKLGESQGESHGGKRIVVSHVQRHSLTE